MTSERSTRADEFAEALIAARKTQTPIAAERVEEFAEGFDRETAYAVQETVAAAVGPIGAWKTGRKREDEPVIAAPIFANTVRASGKGFSADEIGACGIELEIAFRLDDEPPSPDDPDFEDKLRAASTPVPVIEIVHGRLETFTDAAPELKLADNQVNGGLIVGDPEASDERNLVQPKVRLVVDDREIVNGATQVPGGDAFAIFAAFVRMLGTHCGGLKKGHVVTTGTLTGMIFVEPGTAVEGHIEGLGTVVTRFG